MKYFVFSCLVLFLLTSCTTLQWRSSDREISSAFAKAKIPTLISYVDIDSLHLKVRIQSVMQSASATNLVFLHGSPSSLSAWNGYLKDSLLHTKANLHAIDRPGYGYSNFGDAMTSIDVQAKVISRVINEKQLEHVIVIGTSYGGPVAARLAIENTAVKAVIMVSPAIDPENEQRIWQAAFTQYWLTRWIVPTGYRVAGDEKITHAQELSSIEKDWDQVTVPVLHIHGDADELVPYENVEYTQRFFVNNEIVTIPDMGHEIAWKEVGLMIPYIVQMIEQVEKNKALKQKSHLHNGR